MVLSTSSPRIPILSRLWIWSCITAILLYATFQAIIEWDHKLNKSPLCGVVLEYAKWTWYSNLIQYQGLVTMLLILMMKHFRGLHSNNVSSSAYYIVCCCTGMSTVSSFLTLTYDWGGVCVDALGVATPAAIWAEWLFACPLLMFATLGVDDKPTLAGDDLLIIAFMFISILFGFFIVFPQPVWSACIWLALSCLTYMTVFKVHYDARVRLARIGQTVDGTSEELLLNLEWSARKLNLASVFTTVMQVYVVVYMLALFRVLDFDGTRVAYQFCDLITKGLFSLFVMDSPTQLLSPAALAVIEMRRENECITAFMKYIFHEVRVPLNSLVLGIEFISESKHLDSQEREALMTMREASTFMTETLNDVLDMQRIRNGKLALDLKPFSLRQSIRTIFRTFQALVSMKLIALLVEVDDDFPGLVIGDRSRIEHITANFLSNAIKFSPTRSKIFLKVTSRQVLTALPKNRVEVTVAVTDKGVGISEEDQKKLFTSFMQVRPGELQEGRGSGVGLSICKQLVVLHGGSVRCESVLNEGSTFSFTIPMDVSSEKGRAYPDNDPIADNDASSDGKDEDEDEDGQKGDRREFGAADDLVVDSSEEVKEADHSASLDGTVLVVDDVSSNRKMLQMLLQKRGLEVEMAEDGQQAVSLVLANPNNYCMIFMDNIMPKMNGPQATSVLRSRGFERLIVGVTGCAMDEDVSEYVSAGADLVVIKPLNMRTVDSVLDHVRAHGSRSLRDMKLAEVDGKMCWVQR